MLMTEEGSSASIVLALQPSLGMALGF
jgi:hypothetical protein